MPLNTNSVSISEKTDRLWYEIQASFRSPKIANTLEVYTINGSCVIANTAGIESTSKPQQFI